MNSRDSSSSFIVLQKKRSCRCQEREKSPKKKQNMPRICTRRRKRRKLQTFLPSSLSLSLANTCKEVEALTSSSSKQIFSLPSKDIRQDRKTRSKPESSLTNGWCSFLCFFFLFFFVHARTTRLRYNDAKLCPQIDLFHSFFPLLGHSFVTRLEEQGEWNFFMENKFFVAAVAACYWSQMIIGCCVSRDDDDEEALTTEWELSRLRKKEGVLHLYNFLSPERRRRWRRRRRRSLT